MRRVCPAVVEERVVLGPGARTGWDHLRSHQLVHMEAFGLFFFGLLLEAQFHFHRSSSNGRSAPLEARRELGGMFDGRTQRGYFSAEAADFIAPVVCRPESHG